MALAQQSLCTHRALHTPSTHLANRRRGRVSVQLSALPLQTTSCSVQGEPLDASHVPHRRHMLATGLLLSLAGTLPPIAAADTTAPISSQGEAFEDDEYTLFAPGGFNYVDIAIPRKETGPAPERSPLRVRFDAQEGGASLSVVVKVANQLKPTFIQVNDITGFGEPEQAANLLLPRGALLLGSSKEVVTLRPRKTSLGEVEVPPRTYYRYEFTTPSGEHVFMSAAAARGKVYVCGGSAMPGKWEQGSIGQSLKEGAISFRLKEATPVAV